MILTYMCKTCGCSFRSREFGNVERFIEPCILLLLSKSDAHGYKLMEDLVEHCGEKVDIGDLYRTLRKMEMNGWVISSWDKNDSGPDRRIYMITRDGKEFLDVAATSLIKTDRLIHRFLESHEGNFRDNNLNKTEKGDNYMHFAYTVTTTKKSFNVTVKSVEEETKNAGFRVLYIHDVTKTLAEKGFTIEPFKIIEICNAKTAYTVLQADIKIGLMLPCKINVYQKDRQTFISGMRPIIISQFFPQADLGDLPKEVDAIIRGIIDKSK